MEQQKKVHIIAPEVSISEDIKSKYKQKRVAAYCRVSTQQEEQINSYEVQTRYYTEKINAEPKWKLVRIFADKGISGTSTKHRDEFNKMIRMCKRGKIDMIITKSISRFARNTVDCLKYVRMLRDLNIDVYFEEQGIHSIEKGSEFYITVYGSLAQSESENISANVRWGKEQCAKEGKVQFRYKNTLGYRKGVDGNPEIVPDEAEIIRYIYQRFLAGDSYGTIKTTLEEKGVNSPSGKSVWSYSTIRSILTNERYKGDMVINKTFVVDCISKRIKKNNGERPKYGKDVKKSDSPAAIEKMKKGVFIINTSRGGLIDSKALLEGLKEKKVGAVGLDVYEEEANLFYKDNSLKIINDDVLSLLIQLPNVIITSHQAYLTHEALDNIAKTTVQNMDEYFGGSFIQNELCYHCEKNKDPQACYHARAKRCF